MGHLNIVNVETIQDLINYGCVSITGTLGKYREKTLADLFSSVLCMRSNQYVFPWETRIGNRRGRGFFGIFRVGEHQPYLVQGENFPIKVPIDLYEWYPNPVSEYIALDLYRPSLLWNAIGKKSLTRPRSITPQTPSEDDILINLIRELNPEGPQPLDNFSIEDRREGIEITIDLNQNSDNLQEEFLNLSKTERLRNIQIEDVQWVAGNKVKYEKVLEAWLMEHIDDRRGPLDEIISPSSTLIWFGNYLPFGVIGENIDILTIHQSQESLFCHPIELKKDSLSEGKWREAIDKVVRYSNFISVATFEGDRNCIQPVVIAHSENPPSNSIRNYASNAWNGIEVRLSGYSIDSGQINFELFELP